MRDTGKILLEDIANEIGIHPVYLSQQFHYISRDSFGEYIPGNQIVNK